jgi:SpoIID/LytB domain protein
MCQWGARGMALAGHGYREILAFYYPGARLATAAAR